MLAYVASGLTRRFVQPNGTANVVITRQGGSDTTNPARVSTAPFKAFYRRYSAQEVVQRNGSVIMGDTLVVIDAEGISAITNAFGPGPVTLRTSDKISLNGQERALIAPAPIVIGSTTVRLDLQVRG